MSMTSTPEIERVVPRSRLTLTAPLVLFSLTLFASASLLFLVQPLIGKLILPFFGGTPAVWASCMVFFQAVLLAGYCYAHVLASRLEPRRQALIHLVVVLLPLAAFYLAPVGVVDLAPSARVGPALGVLLMLLQLIAVPFFVLSTTAPLLQRWFGATTDPAAQDPYFLYAASNLGSMIALLSFPFLLEPNLRLPALGFLWMIGYSFLALLTAACAGWIIRTTNAPAPAGEAAPGVGEAAPSLTTRCRWVLLAFVPSSLMLGVTTYITTDIAAVPLLWILPLTLYLLSFILVFSRSTAGLTDPMVLVFPVAVLLVVFLMMTDIKPHEQWIWRFAVNLAALFVVAMVCHGELAKTRPATEWLTGYYLCLSLGGVLGGAFNGLLAPLLFNSIAEYPLVLTLGCACLAPLWLETKPDKTGWGLIAILGLGGAYFLFLLLERWAKLPTMQATGWKSQVLAWLLILGLAGLLLRYALLGRGDERRQRWLDIGLPFALGVIALGMILLAPFKGQDFSRVMTWLAVAPADQPILRDQFDKLLTYVPLIALCYGLAGRPVRFALGVGALLTASAWSLTSPDVLHQERSFFGVHRVEVWRNDGSFGLFHALTHGTTIHGLQRAPADQTLIRTARSGAATMLAAAQPLQAAASGLAVAETLRDLRCEPMAYFHRGGPIGQLFTALRLRPRPPRQIAVLGLGSGTLAGYLRSGEHATIYEIDEVAVRIAQDPRYFTYLRDTRGTYDIVMGDGRLKLAEAPASHYDLLFMDAFSSDSIPVHLVTREAIELYFQKLKPNGILVVNVANRYLDPTPVLANIARELGLVGLFQHDPDTHEPVELLERMVKAGLDPEVVAREGDYFSGKFASSWVILAREPRDFGLLASSHYEVHQELAASALLSLTHCNLVFPCLTAPFSRWLVLTPEPDKGIWTDDYSNLFRILK